MPKKDAAELDLAQQTAEYEDCNATIKRTFASAEEFYMALRQMHHKRLYLVRYTTIEEWARKELGIGKRRFYQLLEKPKNGGAKSKLTTEQKKVVEQLPAEEQDAAVAEIEDESDGEPTNEVVERIVEERAVEALEEEEYTFDDLDQPIIRPDVAKAFAQRGEMDGIMRDIQRVRGEVKRVAGLSCGKAMNLRRIDAALKDAYQAVKYSQPYCIMPEAAAHLAPKQSQLGWLTKLQHGQLPREFQ
jgi:hypothetical protein